MEPFRYDERLGLFTIDRWQARNPTLIAGMTSRRLKGTEEGNLAFHVSENAEDVIETRKIFAGLIQVSPSSLTCALQPHGKEVVIVDEKMRGAGAFALADAIEGADGLLTDSLDILLTLFFADCVPLFFFDPGKRVVGVAHAGWRGTTQNIGRVMIERMEEHFGSSRSEILAAIGPSIGPCCYQVDEKVMGPVRERLPKEWHLVATAEGEEHHRLDLRKTNQILLEKEGIRRENIEITHICTSCRNDLLFSHRREKGKTGRMAAFIGLRGERA